MKAHQTFFMDCHLAGRKYYDADLVWDHLRIGQSLRLERDMQNPHDPNAVQVIYNKDGENYLLGFIPRSDNQQLAAFLEMGWTDIFDCRINSLNPDTHPDTSPSASAATGARAPCPYNKPKSVIWPTFQLISFFWVCSCLSYHEQSTTNLP